eukprot:4614351-Alexandrium_andersonii.AAC.1
MLSEGSLEALFSSPDLSGALQSPPEPSGTLRSSQEPYRAGLRNGARTSPQTGDGSGYSKFVMKTDRQSGAPAAPQSLSRPWARVDPLHRG